MINRRILIASLAACALSAGLAGGASAMPDHIDGVPTSDETMTAEVRLFEQRASAPQTAPQPVSPVIDREYELAGYVRVPAGTTAPAWFDALMVRSDALNRMYGLGEYAGTSDPRSEELNRIHGLGSYADPAH
jgi:hypothetical protein